MSRGLAHRSRARHPEVYIEIQILYPSIEWLPKWNFNGVVNWLEYNRKAMRQISRVVHKIIEDRQFKALRPSCLVDAHRVTKLRFFLFFYDIIEVVSKNLCYSLCIACEKIIRFDQLRQFPLKIKNLSKKGSFYDGARSRDYAPSWSRGNLNSRE